MNSSHRWLIGPPLLITSVFCFGFILMQAHSPAKSKPTASSHTSPLANVAESELPTLSPAPSSSLTELSPESTDISAAPEPTTTTPTAPATSVAGPITDSSQPSTNGTSSLQSASASHQTPNLSSKTTPKVQLPVHVTLKL